MDPHNDVRADVDYQAVLSHMNIHKGKTTSYPIRLIIFIFFDQIKFLTITKHHLTSLNRVFVVHRSKTKNKTEHQLDVTT